MQETPSANPHITISQGEGKVSEIQSLTREIQERTSSAAWWDKWYLRLVGITVVVAGITAGITFIFQLHNG